MLQSHHQGADTCNSRGRRRQQASSGLLILLLLALLVTGVASSASADDAPAQGSGLPDIIPPPDPMAPNVLEAPGTDLGAAEALPHIDLERDEAAHLLSSVFDSQLQQVAGIFDDLSVRKLYSPNVAVIEQPDVEGAEPALLESNIPLGVVADSGELEAVDLDLEHDGSELQPASPLVEMEIPNQLGEGFSLPEVGIEVELENGAEDRAPSVLDENVAFFPNVSADTDLAVLPSPGGFETLTQLRSAAASPTQRFHLTLPSGAELKSTSVGGAEVSTEGDKPLLVIPPPTVLDAAGQEVPVSLEVSGSMLIVTVNPGPAVKYPVLVDPLFEQPYVWLWNHSFAGMADWRTELSTAAKSVPYEFTFREEGYIKGVGFFPGLTIKTGVGTAPNWSQAKWYYAVPRFGADYQTTGERPTSFIRTFTLHRLWYTVDEGLLRPITPNPVFRFGLWNTGSEQWTAEGHRYGTEGNLSDLEYTYYALNPSEQPGAKVAVFMLDSGTEAQLQYREVLAGEASIELSDKDAPGIGQLAAPSGWANTQPVSPLTITASDPGLGVKEVLVKQPEGVTKSAKSSCTGIVSSPCPRTWKSSNAGTPQLNYEPQTMPQGVDFVELEAVDPIGRRSPEEGHGAAFAQVKVDHTAPSLSLSGSATEQAGVGNSSQYTLNYTATDGDNTAASALTSFGSAGTGAGKFEQIKGVAVDAGGNVWAIDSANRRVEKFSSTGQLLMEFGSAGTGNGQFTDPRGIAISANGTIWVSDMGNNNVQAFDASGQFIRKITYASFADPYALAPAPGGMVWVSDITSDQLYEFNENGTFIRSVNQAGSGAKSATGLVANASGGLWLVDYMQNVVQAYDSTGKFLMQFGSTGSGNGQLQSPIGIALAPSGNVMVSDAGNNRLQEFQPTGNYLRQFGSLGSGTGQMAEARGLAFGPDGTLYVADAGNHRVDRWRHADLDRQSGVAKTEVKVDGQLAEAPYSPGCPTEVCSISREWIIKANAYSSGTHKVEVSAIDGVGLTTTKTFNVTTDGTAPQLTANSKFFTAPEGWLEQKSYIYIANATDTGGYGVTSVKLKVDGALVKETSQSCSAGGCSAGIAGTINTAGYKGGAHTGELIATDAAGNVSKKIWTINVDPKGEISTTEAEDTLEAVEETSPANLVGQSQEEEQYPGTAPGLGLEETAEGLKATGTEVPTVVGTTPHDGVEMEGLSAGAFAENCSDEELGGTEEPEEESHLEAPEPPEPCISLAEIEETEEQGGNPGLTLLELTPVQTSNSATENELAGDVAAVAANTSSNVDSVIRPLYDGAMTFQAIRNSSGPEAFSWEVQLESGQELKSIDQQHAVVDYAGGYPAFGLSAVAAHDATGASVPTTLTVSEGKIITLAVEHHKAAEEGHPYIYPIIAGVGWEGGFQTYSVEMPPPESPEEEEEEKAEEEEAVFETFGNAMTVRIKVIGPPVYDATISDDPSPPGPVRAYTMTHKFKFHECRYGDPYIPELAPEPIYRRATSHACRQTISRRDLLAAMAVHGWYHDNQRTNWVWISKGNLDCDKWGDEQPAMVHCEKRPDHPVHGDLQVLGDFRFGVGKAAYNGFGATCVTVRGRLDVDPSPAKEESIARVVRPDKPCQWP
jgi:NHL repeat